MADTIRRIWHEIHFALCKLNEIQFSAPWRTDRPTC